MRIRQFRIGQGDHICDGQRFALSDFTLKPSDAKYTRSIFRDAPSAISSGNANTLVVHGYQSLICTSYWGIRISAETSPGQSEVLHVWCIREIMIA
jgi:hypothetical protein